jgi:hypothetical protein
MSPYRDGTAGIEAEIAALEAQQHRLREALPTGRHSLFVRRTARIAAGITGAAFGPVLVARASLGGLAPLLAVAWAAVVVAYAGAALAANQVLRRALARPLVCTGEPFRDLAALRAADLVAVERALDDRRAHASYAWPLVAITVLGPATLHVLVGLVLGATARELDEWLVVTSVFSAHVYAYALITAWRFPRVRKIGHPVTVATLLSLVPGIACACLSSLVVLATAGAIALVGYAPMAAIMRREQFWKEPA